MLVTARLRSDTRADNCTSGWTFDGRHHFSKARWGRGNCWVTVAIPDFIEMLDLPPSDGLRQFLTTSLVAQIDALVKYGLHLRRFVAAGTPLHALLLVGGFSGAPAPSFRIGWL